MAWARDVCDSLARLCAHAGLADSPVGVLRHSLDDIGEPGGGTAVARCIAALSDVRAALDRTVADPVTEVLFDVVASAAEQDARRAGVAHGITVAPDITGPIGPVRIPAASAGALIDALGRVVQDTVAFGSGAFRIVTHVERDELIVVLGDRGSVGDDPSPETQLDGRRRAGLHAAGGCLAAVGGEVSGGVGSWGGVSVTLRVPTGAQRDKRPEWASRWR